MSTDLDTRVAHEVMEWHLDGGHWLNADGSDSGWRDFADWHQWRPSKDFAAALEVVKHFYRVRIEHTDGGEWEVGFWANQYGGIRRAKAATLPHAICLAALLWQ